MDRNGSTIFNFPIELSGSVRHSIHQASTIKAQKTWPCWGNNPAPRLPQGMLGFRGRAAFWLSKFADVSSDGDDWRWLEPNMHQALIWPYSSIPGLWDDWGNNLRFNLALWMLHCHPPTSFPWSGPCIAHSFGWHQLYLPRNDQFLDVSLPTSSPSRNHMNLDHSKNTDQASFSISIAFSRSSSLL